MTSKKIESRIRALSYAMWEREGRPEGKAEEYWERARRQVEDELLLAALEGNNPDLALPHLRISQRPVRYDGYAKAA